MIEWKPRSICGILVEVVSEQMLTVSNLTAASGRLHHGMRMVPREIRGWESLPLPRVRYGMSADNRHQRDSYTLGGEDVERHQAKICKPCRISSSCFPPTPEVMTSLPRRRQVQDWRRRCSCMMSSTRDEGSKFPKIGIRRRELGQ